MITIPKYVSEILNQKRIVLASCDEQAENSDAFGYTFRLYRYTNGQYEKNHLAEADRIVNWAKREYAEARVVREVRFSEKEHRKPFYKRDYILIVITDPVANKFEREIKYRSTSK